MGFTVYNCHPEARGISIQIPHFDKLSTTPTVGMTIRQALGNDL